MKTLALLAVLLLSLCVLTPGCSSDEASSSASCKGVARSCSGMVLGGSCATQQGCYHDIGSYSTSSDDTCAGSAKACDEFDNDLACKKQEGCTWE